MATATPNRDNFIRKVHEALSAAVSPTSVIASPKVGDAVCAGVVCPGKGLYFARATVLGLTNTTRRVFCFDIGSIIFVPKSRIWALGDAAAAIPQPTFRISTINGSSCRKVRVASRTPAALERVVIQSINHDASCGVTLATTDPAIHDALLRDLQLAAVYAAPIPPLEVGDFVLALSQPDEHSQVWCRSLVLCFTGNGQRATVEHIDYGCFEDVPLRNMKTLPPYLAIENALALILRTDLAGITVELNGEYGFAIGDPIDEHGRIYLLAHTDESRDETQGVVVNDDDYRLIHERIVQADEMKAVEYPDINTPIQPVIGESIIGDPPEKCLVNVCSCPVEFLLAEREHGSWIRALITDVLPRGPLGELFATMRLLCEEGSHSEDELPPTDSFTVLVASGHLSSGVHMVFVKALGQPLANGSSETLPVAIRI